MVCGHAFHSGWFEVVLWAIFCLYTHPNLHKFNMLWGIMIESKLIPWFRSLWCHQRPGKLTTALGLRPRAVVSFPGRWWHHNDRNQGINSYSHHCESNMGKCHWCAGMLLGSNRLVLCCQSILHTCKYYTLDESYTTTQIAKTVRLTLMWHFWVRLISNPCRSEGPWYLRSWSYFHGFVLLQPAMGRSQVLTLIISTQFGTTWNNV